MPILSHLCLSVKRSFIYTNSYLYACVIYDVKNYSWGINVYWTWAQPVLSQQNYFHYLLPQGIIRILLFQRTAGFRTANLGSFLHM